MVIDASTMVEALVGQHPDAELLDALTGEVDAPHLLDVEVTSALRGLQLGGKLDPATAEQALRDYLAFSITRHEMPPFAERIWQLRHQYTSYDACYLSLAEALEVSLYTCDAKLAGTVHDAEVRVTPRTS